MKELEHSDALAAAGRAYIMRTMCDDSTSPGLFNAFVAGARWAESIEKGKTRADFSGGRSNQV